MSRRAEWVVVTGAAGGIGESLVETFRSEGFRVISVDRRRPKAPGEHFLAFDLAEASRSEEKRDALVTGILGVLGQDRLHGLIHNAAVQLLGDFSRLSFSQWKETFDVNLFAPVFVSQGLVPRLRDDRGGIVHISSIHDAMTKRGFTAYATSKAALSGLTRAMSLDLAPEVRVNAIAPAAIDTPMLREGFQGHEESLQKLKDCHPLRKIGTPEDVARMAVYLLSGQSSFITGQTFYLTGGINSLLHDPSLF